MEKNIGLRRILGSDNCLDYIFKDVQLFLMYVVPMFLLTALFLWGGLAGNIVDHGKLGSNNRLDSIDTDIFWL